jgi:hypothetical protein
MRNEVSMLGGALVVVAAMSTSARAQEATSTAADSSPDAQAQSNPSPGTLTIERVPSGWVISPDVTMTQVNKQFGTLIGAYGGYLTDRTFLVGAGGYWLANNQHNLGMAYGGLVVQVVVHSDQRIGFAVKGLIGGGDSTVSATYRDVYGSAPPPVASPNDVVFGRSNNHHPGPPPVRPPVTPDTVLVFHEGFFIAEPQAQLMWHLNPHIRLTVGGGYRIIAGADPVNDRLRGPIGSIGVEFGGGQ